MSLPLTGAGKSRGEILTGYAIRFNGMSTDINCGSGATLDDIPAAGGEITVSAWVRFDADQTGAVVAKGSFNINGWLLFYSAATGTVRWRAVNATTSQVVDTESFVLDRKLHYVVGYYNDTTKVLQAAFDGRWGSSAVAVGAYVSDAARALILGKDSAAATSYLDGAEAWVAIWSDDHHVAGTDFIPPRAPPAPGGNLVECWPMDEGSGATAAATVSSPANDGAIVNGVWVTL